MLKKNTENQTTFTKIHLLADIVDMSSFCFWENAGAKNLETKKNQWKTEVKKIHDSLTFES